MSHNNICPFGRFAGQPWTRVPVSYLRVIAASDCAHKRLAAKELERRGTVMPRIQVSAHAVDRASLNCFDIYRRDREKTEGLHSWLVRKCLAALEGDPEKGKERLRIDGMILALDRKKDVPVLCTVIRQNSHDR